MAKPDSTNKEQVYQNSNEVKTLAFSKTYNEVMDTLINYAEPKPIITFATIEHYSGISDKALQKLMEHKNFNITVNSYIQDIDDYIWKEF